MVTTQTETATAQQAQTGAAPPETGANGTTTQPRVAGAGGQARIERLILHGLNPARGELRLVDEIALLSSEIEPFFAGHIAAAASRADWRARFSQPQGEVPALCRALLGDQDAFVAASQQLARRLYDQMRARRSIAPGDFVVIVYRDASDHAAPDAPDAPDASGEGLRHIALLKLDPDQRLVRSYSTVEGRTRVTIAAAANLLPDSARLQKCALLTLAAPAAPFAVTLLDTQAGPRAEGIAAFFYRNFLTTELIPSPRRRTREFLRCCDTWLSERSDDLTPHELLDFYQARRAALAQPSLDLAAFVAAALPQSAALQDELRRRLSGVIALDGDAGTQAQTFTVDPTVARPLLERVTLELDGGARLSLPAERFAELAQVAPARTADNKFRITLESLTLREASDR